MSFKPVDRFINSEIGVWEQTIDKWEDQGMKKGAIKNFLMYIEEEYFGLDIHEELHIDALSPFPFQKEKILSEDDRYQIILDEFGIKKKRLKEGLVRGLSSSMDLVLKNPVKDSDDWDKWKQKFIYGLDERYPKQWTIKTKTWKNRNNILFLPGIGQLGFYSFLRNIMGPEHISIMFYDDPKLIQEILEFLSYYFIELISKAVKEVEIDYFMYFEDIAYNRGPLLSPKLFKKFFSKNYRKVNDFLIKNGIDKIFIDTDGDIRELIPTFLDIGINGLFPIEAAAGMDILELRNEFRELLMIGGVDKRAISNSKEEILEQIKKIDLILEKGGYIPTVDHLIPPNVSYENFKIYLDCKTKILKGA